MNFVGNLGYVAVAITGSFLAVQGIITVGDIQAFIQYVKNFTQPITQLTQVSQRAAADGRRRRAHLRVPGRARGGAGPRDDHVVADVECEVEFDHVHFGYDPEKPVIKDFSARVTRGPDRGARGTHRRRQDHDGEAAHALLRRAVGLHQDRRPRHPRLRARRPAHAVRHGAAGHVAVQRLHPRQHPLRQAGRHRRGGGGGGEGGLRPPLHPDAARGLRLPRSTRTPATSARASGSCSPSRAPSWPTAACSSSTRPRARWTRAPRSASRRPWTTSWPGAPRSSSRTACPPSRTRTSSSSSATATSWSRARTRNCSRLAVSTRSCIIHSSLRLIDEIED